MPPYYSEYFSRQHKRLPGYLNGLLSIILIKQLPGGLEGRLLAVV